MALANIVFISLEDWDSIWRRNQFVCAELSRRNASSRILFVGLPRNVSNELRHGRVGVLGRKASSIPAGFENIVVTHPWKLLPDSIGIGRRINQWMFRRHVRRQVRRLGMQRPVLWINAQSAAHMAGRMQEAGVVYDITDDWISAMQSESLRQRILEEDADLCRKAGAVIVCSPRLFEMKRGMTSSLHLIPNGVDAEHYRRVWSDAPVPAAVGSFKKPILGYTGTLHPDRVDVGLILEVARLLPQMSIVLIGPNHLSEVDCDRMRATGNIHLLGPVAYEQIPDYMRAFDVCITPHVVSEFTESLNPIKLWEYLAAGKPIVSTDVAGFREYPQFVYLAKNAGEFAGAVREALIEDPALPGARQAEAKKHSWTRRVDDIERVIDEAIQRREQGISRGR